MPYEKLWTVTDEFAGKFENRHLLTAIGYSRKRIRLRPDCERHVAVPLPYGVQKMPVLPVDYPEPFVAVLGTMLYPNEGEGAQRRAVAARYLAEPIRRFVAVGGMLPNDDLLRIVMDGGACLDDLEQRWRDGTVMGELFKTLFALANQNPERASWEYSARVIEKFATTAKVSGARTSIMEAKRRFLTVAHLWGAYSIRDRKFQESVEVDYTYVDDFESFLTEAEILRKWGQTWKANAPNANSPLPTGTWAMPENWTPAPRKPGWPSTGMIPVIRLPDDLQLPRGRPGRPRRVG